MKAIFGGLFPSPDRKKNSMINGTNRLAKIVLAYRAYGKIFWRALRKRVPLTDLIRTQYPFILPEPKRPPSITLEFTNHCNLSCVYCVRPIEWWPRGYMSAETFAKFVKDVKELDIPRVRVVGNGESTLHPNFPHFIRELKKVVRFLSVLTNGQWRSEEVIYAMLEAPVDLIEISIDAGGERVYEKSRVHGDYDKLLHNLRFLRDKKEELRAQSLINIRLLMRPSQKGIEKKETGRWRAYADSVMPQYLVTQPLGYEKDLYVPIHQSRQSYPRCNLLLKSLFVHWNGDVPLCNDVINRIHPRDLIVGNINQDSLKIIWNHPLEKQYRHAHRHRKFEQIPVCNGCRGY